MQKSDFSRLNGWSHKKARSITEGATDFGAAGVAFLKFVHGFNNLGEVHFVDFKALTDGFEQGDGKFATKVFAKFLQAVEENEGMSGIGVEEFIGVKFEAEGFEELKHAFGRGGIKEAGIARINYIERDANGDGLAMADFVFRKLFEFMRGPMAEIERTGGAELEGVAGGGDVMEMEFGAAMDETLHGLRIEGAELGGVGFDGFEKLPVANKSDFDSLDVAGAFVAVRERQEQVGIIHHGEGRGEGADEILFAKGIDAVFHADTGISLAEGGAGNADMADAAMSSGSGQADHIEQSAAADRNQIRVTVDVITVDVGMDFRDVKVGIFGAFAAFHDDRRADEFEVLRSRGKIGLDLRGQKRLGLGQRFVQHHHDAVDAVALVGKQDVLEERIGGGKDPLGEEHPELKTDLNGALNDGHFINVKGWTLKFEFYLTNFGDNSLNRNDSKRHS